MRSQIGRWGNSLAFRIPKYVVEQLNLKSQDQVECRVEQGKLVIEPVEEFPELTLDELLAEDIEPSGEVDWGKPEGKEAW